MRVLVVDDSAADAHLIAARLRDAPGVDFEVGFAGSVREARERRVESAWDVHLLDFGLPDGDGLGAARELLGDDPQAVIVLMSGHLDQEVDRQAEDLGIADYISKQDLSPDRLSRSVRFALRRAADRRALVASEERYRKLIRTLPDTVVMMVDADERFVLADGGGLGASGFEPHEIEGQEVGTLLPAIGKPAAVDHYRDALAGRPSTMRNTGARTGQTFETDFVPIVEGDEVTGAIAVSRDVTAKEAADLQMRLHSRVLETMTEGVWLASAEDERIVYANSRFADILGYEIGELEGRHVSVVNAVSDQDPIGVMHEIVALLEEHGSWNGEIHNRRKDGSEIWTRSTITRMDHPEHGPVWVSVQQDITEERAARMALSASEERFSTAFAESPLGMAITDLEGRFQQVNDALCRISGYDAEALLGQPSFDFTHPEDLKVEMEAVRALLAGEIQSSSREQRILNAAGQEVWVAVHVTLLREAHGAPRSVLAQVQDITDRRHFEAQLQHMADHDPLTGLLNRRSFTHELERHVDYVRRYGPVGSVVMFDLDHFKAVNDTLGHAFGDDLIMRVASTLKNLLRTTDSVARLGGDEFAVLLPHAGPEEAEGVAAKILAAVRGVALPGAGNRCVTASIGIAPVDGTVGTADEMLVNADLAMYDAKEDGRDRVAHFSSAEHAAPRLKARLSWLERIERALDDDELVLHAQPIVDLRTNEVAQHELLLRMVSPDGDLIPPGTFLYVAERFGLAPRIDRWVARKAISLLAGHPGARFAVNLSGSTLSDDSFVEDVDAWLGLAGVDGRRLCFEITETAAVGNITIARKFTSDLRQLGCQVALDDFGAGFGSFYYLKHLPFDLLKIDGEFVRNSTRSTTDQLVIRALVGIAQGLGKDTVAEFTEDARTLRFLQREGVDLAQGYFFSKPMPVAEAMGAESSRAAQT